MAKKRITLVKDFESILASGNIEDCKKVFDKCDINAKTYLYKTNAFGCRPLSHEFAFWLKEQGCDIEYKDNYDNTPIFHQITKFEDNFDLMVELGANIFAIDKSGLTLLHKTARFGNLIAIKKLLNYGFDINITAQKSSLMITQYTPLEYAFVYGSFLPMELLEFTKVMIEHGAIITDIVKEQLIKKGENFEFRRDSYQDKETLESFDKAYTNLYQLVGITAPNQIKKHDGVSDIIVEGKDFSEKYNSLWEFLVPGSGQAKSAQGECIRLVGRLSNEILGNGGMNWCNDFKLMANSLYGYLKIGNALDSKKLEIAEKITKSINKNTKDSDLQILSEFALEWVFINPKVLPLIETKYKR